MKKETKKELKKLKAQRLPPLPSRALAGISQKEYKKSVKKFKGEQNANEKSAAKQAAAAKTSTAAATARALPETEQGAAGLGKSREF